MNRKMKTSVALLAVSLLCFTVAEAQHPENQKGKDKTRLIPDDEPAVKRPCPGDFTSMCCILRELEAKLRNTERQLEDLKRKITGNQVAFGAAMGNVGNVGPFHTHFTLVYKEVFSNTGAYNPKTGIFTAPVRGFYYFSFSGYNQSSRSMGIRLMKNEQNMVVIFNHPAGNRHEAATNGMTLQLEVGDQVYMRLLAHTWVNDDLNGHSTFTGHLLFHL